MNEKHRSFWDINQQPFKELLTFVDFADDRLNIAFAEINFAQDRDLIIKKLIEHSSCKDIQFEILDFSDPDLRFVRDELVKALQKIKIAADKKLVLLVTGLEKLIGVLDEYPPVLVDLNYVRDDLAKSVPHPIIFLLPEYALTRLAKYAPDFWAWVRKIFNFNAVKSDVENTIFSYRGIYSLKLPEKRERIDLLLRLLNEYSVNKKSNQTKIINICNELGIAFRTLGDYRKAIYYNQWALKIAQESLDNNGQSNALNGLGNNYDSLGEFHKAIDYYQRAFQIAQENSDRYIENMSLNNLGKTYSSLHNFTEAIVVGQKSLEIAQQLEDRYGMITTTGNLGIAYYHKGEFQQAIYYYQKSLEIARQIEDLHSEANSLNNLGSVYHSIGDFQQAICCCQKSLKLSQEIGERRLQAAILNNLGIAYYHIGEFQQAINYYQESLHMVDRIGDRRLEANSWFNLGQTLKKLERNVEAITAYKNAIKIFEGFGAMQYIDCSKKAIQELENQTQDSE